MLGMEIRKFLAISVASAASFASAPASFGFGEDELIELPREVLAWVQSTVFVQVEWIEVDLKDYAKMTFEQEGIFNSTEFRHRVQALIEDDKAELKEVAMVNTRSGQRAKTESINEVIYPTEFDPGEVSAVASSETDSKGKTTVTEYEPMATTEFPPPGAYPNPTAFEMRPVGVTLEVDPVVGADNETIELNIAPEIVKLVGESVWQQPIIDGKPVATVRQPEFHSMKQTTAVTLLNGGYCLIDIQQPVDDEGKRIDGKKWLVFVKAWLEPVVPQAIRDAIEGGELPE